MASDTGAPLTFPHCKQRSRLFEAIEPPTSKRPRKGKTSIRKFVFFGKFAKPRGSQGRKSLCIRRIGVLRVWCFDPVAEASELPKHLRSAELLRSFGDRRAPFFVTDSLVQDQPDQATLSMGNGPDSLIM